MKQLILLLFISSVLTACGGSNDDSQTSTPQPDTSNNDEVPTSDSQDNNDSNESPSTDTTTLSSSVYTRSDNCDRDNVDVATAQATLLIGGAEQNATGEIAATQWLLDNATGGDYLVIRSDGIGSQANWVCDNFSASINSAAELNLTSQTLANDDRVVKIIEDADIIFFAGGDQSAYRSAW